MTFNGYIILGMSFSMIGFAIYSIWVYTRLEDQSTRTLIDMLAIDVLVISALAYIVIDHAYSLSPRQFLAALYLLVLDTAAMTIIHGWTIAKVKTKEQHFSRWVSTVMNILMAIMFIWLGFATGLFHL